VAEEAAREVLALPIYPELTSDQQDFIVSSIQSFYKG
jgi:dTDP-4-amino-4,6-dideoxygalactose transaminase